MASAIKCDGPDCDEATIDSVLAGWTRIEIRNDTAPLPAGDYDFHDPACLKKWVTANAKKPDTSAAE